MFYDSLRVLHHLLLETNGVDYLMLFISGILLLLLAIVYLSIDIDALNCRIRAVLKNGLVLLFLCYCVYFIVSITLLRRSPSESKIVLIPFTWVFKDGGDSFKSILYDVLNILLFVPFSFFLSSFDFGWSSKTTAIISIVVSLLFSFCIEAIQYVFALGTFEMEDIICNSFGGVIGSLFAIGCSKN